MTEQVVYRACKCVSRTRRSSSMRKVRLRCPRVRRRVSPSRRSCLCFMDLLLAVDTCARAAPRASSDANARGDHVHIRVCGCACVRWTGVCACDLHGSSVSQGWPGPGESQTRWRWRRRWRPHRPGPSLTWSPQPFSRFMV